MLDQHVLRRRPVIWHGRDHRRGAGFAGMACERGGDRGAGVADMGDELARGRLDMLDREFEQCLAFGNREAHGFAGMHRQRQALRAAGEMEIKHIAVTREIDTAIGEWRHRRMHQAEFEITHVD